MGFITQNGLFWICLIPTYPNYTICFSWHLALQATLERFDDRSDLKIVFEIVVIRSHSNLS